MYTRKTGRNGRCAGFRRPRWRWGRECCREHGQCGCAAQLGERYRLPRADPVHVQYVRDGDETDRDCGGSCGPCVPGLKRLINADCTSGKCDSTLHQCGGNHCLDRRLDVDETDVDCGGLNSCSRCTPGRHCTSNADCAAGQPCNASHVCDWARPACAHRTALSRAAGEQHQAGDSCRSSVESSAGS